MAYTTGPFVPRTIHAEVEDAVSFPPGAATNQNRFAWTRAAPPTSSASSPIPARTRSGRAGPFTASVRIGPAGSTPAVASTVQDAAAADAAAAAAVATAAAADAAVAAQIARGSAPRPVVIAPYPRGSSRAQSQQSQQRQSQRARRGTAAAAAAAVAAADVHIEGARTGYAGRNRKYVPGEPAALSKGFAASYGIRESLRQYGVTRLDRPASAPGSDARRARRTARRRGTLVPDQAGPIEPPFVHTMQYMGRHGPVASRVNPRLSTRLSRQRPNSKYDADKNALSRRPSSAWFAHPSPGALVPQSRPAWK